MISCGEQDTLGSLAVLTWRFKFLGCYSLLTVRRVVVPSS